MTPAESTGQVPPPVLVQPAATSAREWIAQLVAGRCTEQDFVTQILLQEAADPEIAWEALALLDQQRRRRQLAEGMFQRVKRTLQQHCLRYDVAAKVAAQSPLPAEPAPAGAAPPATLAISAAAAASVADAPAEPNLQPGELLRGRYCIVQVQQQDDDVLLIKALDKVRSDLPSGRQCVAILVLSADSSGQPDVMQRIYRLQSVAHPAIPRVYDVDAEGGRAFFTMDWSEATSLQQLMQREGAVAPGLPAVLSILAELASALTHAHARDLAHGNLSLATVQVTSRNELRLQGFVLDERRQKATASADCLAFAQLAHRLLLKCRVPYLAPSMALSAQREGLLHRPAGLTSLQWRAMELALRTGDATAAGRLLDSFAGAGSVADPRASASVAPRRSSRSPWALQWPQWSLQMGAAASLLAAIGLGGYLVLAGPGGSEEPAAGIAAAAEAPQRALGTSAVATAARKSIPATAATAPAQPQADEPAAAFARDFHRTPLLLASASKPSRRGGFTNAGFGITPRSPAPVAESPQAVAPRGDVLDLPRALVRVEGGARVAKIWVRRRGDLRGPVTFYWWTETGSAQFSRDFTQILRRWEVIDDGAAGIELHVPITADAARTQSRAFYVKIDRAGRGAMLGGRTLAQVEILPSRSEAMAANTGVARQ